MTNEDTPARSEAQTPKRRTDVARQLAALAVAAFLPMLSGCSIDIGNPGDENPFGADAASDSAMIDSGMSDAVLADTGSDAAEDDVAIDLGFPDTEADAASDVAEDVPPADAADTGDDIGVDAEEDVVQDVGPIAADADAVLDGSGDSDVDRDGDLDAAPDGEADEPGESSD
ncbi:MAG: hypothetical protein ACI81R_001739 [Bradymonadia bacterium]|jgi:hypothetical protein